MDGASLGKHTGVSLRNLAKDLDDTLHALAAALHQIHNPPPPPPQQQQHQQQHAHTRHTTNTHVTKQHHQHVHPPPHLTTQNHPPPTITNHDALPTTSVYEHLRRTHLCFSGHNPAEPPPPNPALSAHAFGKLVRAAGLVCERCSLVEADLVFCRVVKSRNGRMTLKQLITALSHVALRLHPEAETQQAALHTLLADRLLEWMVGLEHALVAALLAAPLASSAFDRHAGWIKRCYDAYIVCVAQPVALAVAAAPRPLLQWPQFVCFAQDFELAPALLPWPTLACMWCFAASCVDEADWVNPAVHGATLDEFRILLGWCAFEVPGAPSKSAAPPPGANAADALHSLAETRGRSLIARLKASRGGLRLQQHEAPPPTRPARSDGGVARTPLTGARRESESSDRQAAEPALRRYDSIGWENATGLATLLGTN